MRNACTGSGEASVFKPECGAFDALARVNDTVNVKVVPPPRRCATRMSPPIARASAFTDDNPRPAPPKREAMPALRVLSVEDNPFGRVVLNAVLTELGHQAEFIGRGEAATERIAQGGFDAVLMDMVLPGINGIEAIRRIRELGPPLGRIAIIGVSGRGDDEAASRAAGADAFLVKPVSPRALATALLEATRRAAAAT